MIKDQFLLWTQIYTFYTGTIVFDVVGELQVQFNEVLPIVFLIISLLIKFFRQRKGLLKKIAKCQKKFVIANMLTCVNIYFFYQYNQAWSQSVSFKIQKSFVFFFKTLYFSLICHPKTTSYIQYGFSFASLLFYMFRFTYLLVMIITAGQYDGLHEDVNIRIQTQIGIAYMASLIAQFGFIIDLMTRALRQKIKEKQEEQQNQKDFDQLFNKSQTDPRISKTSSQQVDIAKKTIQNQKKTQKIEYFKKQTNQSVFSQKKSFQSSKPYSSKNQINYQVASIYGSIFNRLIVFGSIASFFISSTLIDLLFTIGVIPKHQNLFFIVLGGILIIFSIISKIYMEKKHFHAIFIKTQKNFAIPYAFTIINFYFLAKFASADSIQTKESLLAALNFVLKMFYYSLLCSKYTISKSELIFSLITLIYYVFSFSYNIVKIIKENQPIDEDYMIRVTTQIGIAYMTVLTIQYSVIMDIQMDCLQEKQQKQNQIQKILKQTLTSQQFNKKRQSEITNKKSQKQFQLLIIKQNKKQKLFDQKKDTVRDKPVSKLKKEEQDIQQKQQSLEQTQICQHLQTINSNRKFLLEKDKSKSNEIEQKQLQTTDLNNQKIQNQKQSKINQPLKKINKDIISKKDIINKIQTYNIEDNSTKYQEDLIVEIIQVHKDQEKYSDNRNYFQNKQRKQKVNLTLLIISASSFFISSVILIIAQKYTNLLNPNQNNQFVAYGIQIFLIISLVFKLILQRKKLKKLFFKTQRVFMLPYIFMLMLIYLLVEVDNTFDHPPLFTWISIINLVFSSVYYSLLCRPETISMLQFTLSFVSLSFGLYFQAEGIVIFITTLQVFDSNYYLRVQLYLGITTLATVIAQRSIIMDIQLKAIKKRQKIIKKYTQMQQAKKILANHRSIN